MGDIYDGRLYWPEFKRAIAGTDPEVEALVPEYEAAFHVPGPQNAWQADKHTRQEWLLSIGQWASW